MKNLVASIVFGLFLIPFYVSAETYYFAGNETQVSSGTSKKTGPYKTSGSPVPVWIEMTVEGDKISQRVLKSKSESSMIASGFQIQKSASGWSWTDPYAKKNLPVTVEMAGGRLKSLTRKTEAKERSSLLRVDMSDPVVFRQDMTFTMAGGQVVNSTVIDAGMILPNQWQAQIKGKKLEPPPPHTPGAPGAVKK